MPRRHVGEAERQSAVTSYLRAPAARLPICSVPAPCRGWCCSPASPRPPAALCVAGDPPAARGRPICRHPFGGFQARARPVFTGRFLPLSFRPGWPGMRLGTCWAGRVRARASGLGCEPGPCWLHPRSGCPAGCAGTGCAAGSSPGSGTGHGVRELPREGSRGRTGRSCFGAGAQRAWGELSSVSGTGSPRGAAAGPCLEEPWHRLRGEQPPAWGDPACRPPRLRPLGISPPQHWPQPSNGSCIKSKNGERRAGAGDSGSLFVICIVWGALN